ncbi:hypothetical protein HMPREF0496_2931 [Lentilactobacillus hilgardii ATCC 27305]|nr:hypothetical protein HMPREF0496_2931 [Lentilactobacillus hilgardii ATCC 27305]
MVIMFKKCLTVSKSKPWLFRGHPQITEFNNFNFDYKTHLGQFQNELTLITWNIMIKGKRGCFYEKNLYWDFGVSLFNPSVNVHNT